MYTSAEIFVSGMYDYEGNETPCMKTKEQLAEPVPYLDSDIEEADLRIIPHAVNVATNGHKCIVILSNDTDVLILVLYYWRLIHGKGVEEVWMRAGTGDSTRFIPVHILAAELGSLCQVLPARHCLTGCDVTS